MPTTTTFDAEDDADLLLRVAIEGATTASTQPYVAFLFDLMIELQKQATIPGVFAFYSAHFSDTIQECGLKLKKHTNF